MHPPPRKETTTMRLIPYQPRDIDEPRELVAAIRARRGGALLNLDRMLLHSPPLARGWNGYLRAIRTELEVSPKLRELAICVVAILTGADYEFGQHGPEFLKAGGTPRQLDAVGRIAAAGVDAAAFDAHELAIIELAADMTRNVSVRRATLEAARTALPIDRHLVEIVGVIAAYNMVSRFLVALDVEPE
jgi:alkylhydroperoxidase family enzyme